MKVGLVIVSHSARLAEGVCELARQMAPDVVLVPAGGTNDGGIGTSFDKVKDAIAQTDDDGGGTVILADLGSAVMTAEAVLEFLEPEVRERTRLADAPLVEGAVAAAVSAQSRASVDDVVLAAVEAGHVYAAPAAGKAAPAAAEEAAGPGADPAAYSGTWELINPMGLHARPAAAIAQAMAELDAEVTVNGVNAKSVMMLMTLGLGKGEKVTVTATGEDAERAVEVVGLEVRNGFGEVSD